jgi:uncharacterized protein (DUF427 family)
MRPTGETTMKRRGIRIETGGDPAYYFPVRTSGPRGSRRDEQVFTHPRDPYTRVYILGSSRHVRVGVDARTVAASTSPRMLFETGLPVRYYLPKTHVRMDLLTPTETATRCPYKGQAEYWSVAGHADIARS